MTNLVYKHLGWKEYLVRNVPTFFKQERFLEINFSNLISEKKKYEQLIQSLYIDLDDGLINEAEYQEFQSSYRQKIKNVEETIIQKKQIAQTTYEQLQNKNEWLRSLHQLQEETELNRLTLVTLLDRIDIQENKELTLVFHDVEELSILQSLFQTKQEVG